MVAAADEVAEVLWVESDTQIWSVWLRWGPFPGTDDPTGLHSFPMSVYRWSSMKDNMLATKMWKKPFGGKRLKSYRASAVIFIYFFLASLYVLSNNTTIWCLKTTQTFKNFKAYEERAPLIRAAFISTKNCDRKKFWASKHTSELDNLLAIHDDIILVLLFSSMKTWSFYWWFSRKEYIFHRKEEVVGSYNFKITPGDSDIHCAPTSGPFLSCRSLKSGRLRPVCSQSAPEIINTESWPLLFQTPL